MVREMVRDSYLRKSFVPILKTSNEFAYLVISVKLKLFYKTQKKEDRPKQSRLNTGSKGTTFLSIFPL